MEIRTDLGLDSTYSVTLLTTVDPAAPHPIVFDMRDESNSASDFLTVVKYWIENGHLTQGDYLIVDNATIHVSDEIAEELNHILDSSGVTMILLPTYSPELNSFELVFKEVYTEESIDNKFEVKVSLLLNMILIIFTCSFLKYY